MDSTKGLEGSVSSRPEPRLLKYGDMVLFSGYMRELKQQAEEESDFEDESSEAEPTGPKPVEMVIQGMSFPDYEPNLLSKDELSDGLFASLFIVEPYGDIPMNKASAGVIGEAVASMWSQAEGKTVAYGSEITLRHYISGRRLQVSQKTGDVFGTRKLTMSAEVTNASVITIRPASKYVAQNSDIPHDAQVFLSFERMPTAAHVMLLKNDDEDNVLLGRQSSSLKVTYFNPLEIVKYLGIAVPCHIQAKGHGFFLGASETDVQYVDSKDNSTIWAVMNLEIMKGGCVELDKSYVLFNFQTGQYIGPELRLVDLEDAVKFSLQPIIRGEKLLRFNEEIRVTSEGKMLGVNLDTNSSISLRSLYPKTTKSESPDTFPVAFDLPEHLHQLHTYVVQPFEDSATKLLLLTDLRLSITSWLDELKTSIDSLLSTLTPDSDIDDDADYVEEYLADIKKLMEFIQKEHLNSNHQDKALFTKLKVPTELLTAVFAFLDNKKEITDKTTMLKDVSRVTKLLEKWKVSYTSVCDTLVQMLKTDPKASLQLKKKTETALERITEDADGLPVILKLCLEGGSGDMDLSEGIKAFQMWLGSTSPVTAENVVKQNVVAFSLTRVIQVIAFMYQEKIHEEMQKIDLALRKYAFVKRNETVYVNFLPETAFVGKPKTVEVDSKVFYAVEQIKDDNFAEFIATLLEFYESCGQALGAEHYTELFGDVGISHDLLVTLVSCEASPLLVRAQALKVLASFIPPPPKDTHLKHSLVLFAEEVRSFEQDFQMQRVNGNLSENAQILLKCLTHSNFTSEDSLLEKLLFATSIFAFAKVLAASDTLLLSEIVQKYAISTLKAWNLPSSPPADQSHNWVFTCILEARKAGKAELITQLNLLLDVIFATLKCTLDVKEEVLVKLVVNQCIASNWNLEENSVKEIVPRVGKIITEGSLFRPPLPSDFTSSHLSHLPSTSDLPLTLFTSQVVALDLSFPLTDSTYDLLLRVCNPLTRVYSRLQEVLLFHTKCKELEDITSIVTITDAEQVLPRILNYISGEQLQEKVNEQMKSLNTKIQLLQTPDIQQIAQITCIREESFQIYLQLWDEIQEKLGTSVSSEDKALLLKLACCIFRYLGLLVRGNKEAKAVLLSKLKHPLSDFEKSNLEIADLGELIREMNDFVQVRSATAKAFFRYLHSKYYRKSIECTGAYTWISALLLNHSGTSKPDLQSAAYRSLSDSLGQPDQLDSTCAYTMLVKQATLCTIGNMEIRGEMALKVPVSYLETMLNAAPTADVGEMVVAVLGRVHAVVVMEQKTKGDVVMLQLMQKVLEMGKGVMDKEEEVVGVLTAGLYEQVQSKSAPNIKGWFLTQEQLALVSLLRLISSGAKSEPLGGLTGLLTPILKSYTADNQDLKSKLITDYTDFFKQYQAFLAKLKQRLGTQCDFSELEKSLDLGLTELSSLTKKGAAKAVAVGSMMIKGLTKVVVPVGPRENAFLTPKLQALITSKLTNLGSETNLFPQVIEVFTQLMGQLSLATDTTKLEKQFVTTFNLVAHLMVNQPSKKHVFKVLNAICAGFSKVKWTKAAYAPVLKFWVTQMIAAKDLEELLDGIDFYLHFGSHVDSVRYDELLALLSNDYGPRLFLKIKKALQIELLVRKKGVKGSSDSISHIIRKIRPGRYVTGSEFKSVIEQHSLLAVSYIKLLKAMCDNCNSRMQRFIREQGTDQDVDLVTEVVEFCSDMVDLMLKKQSFGENKELTLTAMDAVADFCTGPCIDNQAIVGKNIKLFLGVNAVFKRKYEKDFSKELDPYVDLRKTTLHLLQVLLEGNASADILNTFQTFLSNEALVTYVTDVYKSIIVPNRTTIELDDFGTDRRHEIVEYAMDTSLFLIQYLNLTGTVLKEVLKTEDSVAAFRDYYLQYCGYVEIYKPSAPDKAGLEDLDNIWGVHFRIPFKCKLLTSESATALIVQVSHASHQEQLTDFMNQVEPLSKEMSHQLQIYHSSVLTFMTNNWALYKDLSLYLVVVINLYVLVAFDTVRPIDTTNTWDLLIILACGSLQSLLYFLGLAFNIVERYPLILHSYTSPESEEMEMDQFYGLSDHDSQKYKHFQEETDDNSRTENGLAAILCYFPTYTGLMYLIGSIIAILYPIFSPVLLLIIIERKVEVQNVLKAVTQNKTQLALSGLLGVIIMYVFAVFAYLYLSNFYEGGENLSNATIFQCLLTTINMGLRGGLADAMGNPDSMDTYWQRYTFDILFHLIIIILLMSVLFGIIIDTFGKLRDERTELYDKINNACYVCDQTRNRIELGGKGWSYHFQVEHSPFAYLAYLVRLMDVEEKERNGIESYVYKLFKETDSSFFPSTSRHLIQALS